MTIPLRDVGSILLEMHRQTWRADAPPLDLPLAEVMAVLPTLIGSGSVGLVWPRLRHRAEDYGAVGEALEAAFRSQEAHNALVEREIARVVSRLGEAGVEPVLIKGYAVARLYPAGLVRTAGDIDLVVRDEEYSAAKAVFADRDIAVHGDPVVRLAGHAGAADSSIDIDLHTPRTWQDDPGTALFDGAEAVPIGGSRVRVPCAEDHLRALVFHFLRHGGARPLRLCDIALLLETRAEDFDWERCLGGSRRQREQIVVTLRLAREMLGARIEDTPIGDGTLPGWLMPEVLRQWNEPTGVPGSVLREVLANPREIASTFRRRWPSPIIATVRMGAPFNEFPRLPIQLAAYGRKIGSYAVVGLPKQLADRLQQHGSQVAK